MITVIACMAVLGWVLLLWQWAVTWRFPMNRRTVGGAFTPPVSILKPLKGADAHTLQCLQSWFEQKYGGKTQLLFGVASETDPVCDIVKCIGKQFAGVDWELVVCGPPTGANAKVSTLIKLSRHAKHEFIVVSDADVLAPRDFLANVIAPLKDPDNGLVNCFYRLANPSTSALRWEAVAINADFWSQVLQGNCLAPQDFALGAVMATRQEELQKIGGFESLSDHLADDFHLGNRIARIARKKIALCPVVVDCLSHPMDWNEVWAHQLRWARTIRACRPLPYAFSILSNATMWPLLWVLVQPSAWSLGFLAWCVAFRIITAQSLQTKLGKTRGQRTYFWMPPVKDVLQLAVWTCAFSGKRIVWRGEEFLLKNGGILVRAGAEE